MRQWPAAAEHPLPVAPAPVEMDWAEQDMTATQDTPFVPEPQLHTVGRGLVVLAAAARAKSAAVLKLCL
jgi:hypothetical protein